MADPGQAEAAAPGHGPAARPSVVRGGEMRSLTGLRGVAAVMVMAYHFVLRLPDAEGWQHGLLSRGYLAVDLFFILSGFVLAHAHGAAFAAGTDRRTYARFLVARLARIYPLYLLVALESGGMRLWRTGGLSPSVLGLNLALLQGWGLADSLEGAAWSVSTEWGAYLVFPLLLAACLGSRRGAWLSAGLAGLAVAGLAALPGLALPGQGRSGPLDIYSAATPAPLLRCLAEFTLGLLTYRVARAAGQGAGRARAGLPARPGAAGSEAMGLRAAGWGGFARVVRGWAPGAATLSCAALLGVLWMLARGGRDVAAVALCCVLVGALSHERGPAARLLGGAGPYWLGRWSYSIYLLHDKFSHLARLLRDRLDGAVPFASAWAMAGTGALVLGCSALCFAAVEQPMRRLVLSWLRGRGATLPGAPSAPAAFPAPAPAPATAPAPALPAPDDVTADNVAAACVEGLA